MARTREQVAAEREAAIAERDELVAGDTLVACIIDAIGEEFTDATAAKLVRVAKLAAKAAENSIGDTREVEAVGAHIVVDHVSYPNGSVGIDAAGNLVSVEFDGPVHLL